MSSSQGLILPCGCKLGVDKFGRMGPCCPIDKFGRAGCDKCRSLSRDEIKTYVNNRHSPIKLEPGQDYKIVYDNNPNDEP